ncbi:PqqD family protein [Egicoccus halophilus]|uniref:Coenzyme PQQ synthesis protein D (PqqD) n=1 Tax=Egicoccus halophilus TaxID=1670830 RepID=A0A8J3ERN6_9ACTN|nr:PqqD family protein [Egicoccus halophilus]GGI05350.1 hypothetical protein GCM10011354_13660 [Egicoccus halophilus]
MNDPVPSLAAHRGVTQTLPSRRGDVERYDGGTESVLFVAGSSQRHVLNAPARAIWEACDGTTTIEELVRAICTVFSVSYGAALHDIEVVLGALERAGLVAWTGNEGRT